MAAAAATNDAELRDLEAFVSRKGHCAVLRQEGSAVQEGDRASCAAAAYHSVTPLPDGRICASDANGAADPRCRRVVLLSLYGPDGRSAPTTSSPPVEVRLGSQWGEGEPKLLQPHGVCAARIDEAMVDTPSHQEQLLVEAAPGRLFSYLFVTDRYRRLPRVLRVGIDASGMEVVPRLQFWDSRREVMADPTELCLSTDRRTLFVTDAGQHAVLVFDTGLDGHTGAAPAPAPAVGDRLRYVQSFGGGGSELGEPYGITTFGSEVFVSEPNLHRISVYSDARTPSEYHLSRVLGGPGISPGKFRRPRGVAIIRPPTAAAASGLGLTEPCLAVAEAKRVQVVSLLGEALQIIDMSGRSGALWGVGVSPWELFVACGSGSGVQTLELMAADGGRPQPFGGEWWKLALPLP